MRRIAFLSMDSLEGFVCYDDLLIAPLKTLGYTAETVSWRNASIRWEDYEAVIIRSTWDYQRDADAFLQTLERIDASGAHLENPLELVRWNMHKGYLRDMERQGIPIVPTIFREAGEALDLEALFEESGVEELVIKPAVSANADWTFRLNRESAKARKPELERSFQNKEALIQPFCPAIVSEGEYSVFYFGEDYSHTICKAPAPGDFRVQEEHGGRLSAVQPEPILLQAAEEVMSAIRPRPLYARADFVRDDGFSGANGDFMLMELELIEPSLYFNLDPDAPARFARVLDRWLGG